MKEKGIKRGGGRRNDRDARKVERDGRVVW